MFKIYIGKNRGSLFLHVGYSDKDHLFLSFPISKHVPSYFKYGDDVYMDLVEITDVNMLKNLYYKNLYARLIDIDNYIYLNINKNVFNIAVNYISNKFYLFCHCLGNFYGDFTTKLDTIAYAKLKDNVNYNTLTTTEKQSLLELLLTENSTQIAFNLLGYA